MSGSETQINLDEHKEAIDLAKRQNDALDRQYSTQFSSYQYKIGQIQRLNWFTYLLIWLYFILSTIYLWILFVGNKASSYTPFYKVGVLVGLMVFPFIITPIEMFVLRFITFVIETVVGNVYKRPDYNYVVDQTYVPNLFQY